MMFVRTVHSVFSWWLISGFIEFSALFLRVQHGVMTELYKFIF